MEFLRRNKQGAAKSPGSAASKAPLPSNRSEPRISGFRVSSIAASIPLHVKARASHPDYPPRFAVDDEHVSWEVPMSDYAPISFTHSAVIDQNCEARPGGWADPLTANRAKIEARGSHELQARQLPWHYDDLGRPLNPRGRTGCVERGCLGKWGPNHAGDAIVTRHRQRAETEEIPPGASRMALEMVAIKRRDTGEWAIPGGMAEPSEVGKAALMREFKEEAGAVSEEEMARFDALLHEVFADSNGRVVYRGYVDDPRNTDNAWMETIAMHFHCSQRLGEMLTLHAGDDAAAVMWLEVGDHNALYRNLYASHKQMVDLVCATHAPSESSDSVAPGVVGGGEGGSSGVTCAGGAAELCGPLAHQARVWAAVFTGMPADASESYLSVSDVLDMYTITPSEQGVAESVMRRIIEEPDLSAVTKQLSGMLAVGDAVVGGNIFENLHSLVPFEVTVRRVGPLLLQHVHELIHGWKFVDDVSTASAPPTLPAGHPARRVRIGRAALDALRLLAFLDKPPALVADSALIASMRAAVFARSQSSFQPTAIVMVGAPGSGKTAVLPQGIGLLRATCGGPPSDAYVRINPDFWISSLCHSNNEHRNVANYLNHETFLTAIAQRRHLVFDSTGKSVLNTCGRVIARLKQAGYRIHFVVVLASLKTCWRRIEARRIERGRSVPYKIAQTTLQSLAHALRTYLLESKQLCESALVFDNDDDSGTLAGAEGADLQLRQTTLTSDEKAEYDLDERSLVGMDMEQTPPAKGQFFALGRSGVFDGAADEHLALEEGDEQRQQDVQGPAKLIAHLRDGATDDERRTACEAAMKFFGGGGDG